jgi:hypothetical protein
VRRDGGLLLLKLDRNRPDLYRQATADVAPDTSVRILDPGQPMTL